MRNNFILTTHLYAYTVVCSAGTQTTALPLIELWAEFDLAVLGESGIGLTRPTFWVGAGEPELRQKPTNLQSSLAPGSVSPRHSRYRDTTRNHSSGG